MPTPEDNKIVPEEVLQQKRYFKLASDIVVYGRLDLLKSLNTQELTEVAKCLITMDRAPIITYYNEFKDVDGNTLIDFILDIDSQNFDRDILIILGTYKDIDSSQVLDKLTEKNAWGVIANGFENQIFDCKLKNWIAEKLLENGHVLVVANCLDNLENLNEFLANDTNFLSILEGVYGGGAIVYRENNGTQLQEIQNHLLNKIEFLLNTEAVKNDPVKILYIVRMFLLFPHKYLRIAELAKNMGGLVASLFGKYQPHIIDLVIALEKVRHSEDSIDIQKPSYNLEIEAMNIDVGMELDTPITNDINLIINFVKKLDEVQKKIREEIAQHLKDSKDTDRQMLGVYDSVHINIGIARIAEDELSNVFSQDIISQVASGIYMLLELIGLVYNSIGRVSYMYKNRLADLITIDENEIFTVIQSVKLGYHAKLQNRLWSFNLTADNAPMLEILMRYMEKLLKHYRLDAAEARKSVGDIVKDVVEFMKKTEEETYKKLGESPEEGLPLTYGELVSRDILGEWIIDEEKLKSGIFPSAYLLDRSEILRFIMRRLSDYIKTPLV